jgi:hypothetical protein
MVSLTLEAEEGGALEPRSLGPAWAMRPYLKGKKAYFSL